MRKTLLLIITATILCGCAVTIKPHDRIVISHFADYSEYAKEGFLISPDAYSGEFDSLGEITINVTPKLAEHKEESGLITYRYEIISHSELVAIAVKEAKDRGADGIVDFKVTSPTFSDYEIENGFAVSNRAYLITGFCIKRR